MEAISKIFITQFKILILTNLNLSHQIDTYYSKKKIYSFINLHTQIYSLWSYELSCLSAYWAFIQMKDKHLETWGDLLGKESNV